ncbi:hypothetical protein LTR50_001466 [Elasticomyces elasticus]|nr:hypothetical protein LTR50_001466 [Elasticomyces elasticus]
MTSSLPSRFQVRPTTAADAPAMAALYFTSFFPSHPFWVAFCPSGPHSERWWQECSRLSIEEDYAARNFVVIDKGARPEDGDGEGKAVAFSRWIVPQRDGNLEKVWPALPDHFDMELCGQFFGGMGENRKELMGSRPHWFLELLGTDEHYQRHGIGHELVKWGCDRADADGLECYLDASMKGAPFYKKHFGFEAKKEVAVPKRPEVYGEFVCVSLVRPVMA